jgi:cytochrome oxidase Cu insertion factor (SCO1/SenC/PrrC family)
MSESVSETNKGEEKRRGRRMLLLLLTLFALPLLIVVAMYWLEWQPGGTSHGQLISPPRPLQLPELQTLQGKIFGSAQWKDKWSLVYVSGQRCDADCTAQLHDLRQIHASLNKEIGRVQRVLLIASEDKDGNLASVQQQYPDLAILAGPGAQQLAGQFGSAAQAGNVYLVDPLGNVMMRYPQGYQARGLRKDLMRLLTYSWAG